MQPPPLGDGAGGREAVPLSGNFNMALRKRVGGETAAFALRTYSVTYPAFIHLQRWLLCLQQQGEKLPGDKMKNLRQRMCVAFCFFFEGLAVRTI